MRLRARREARLHLLEVSVRWPPETFIRWKLQGLAANGVRVTVASRSVLDGDFRLPGVRLKRLPDRTAAAGPAGIGVVVREGVAALIMAPRRLVRLLRIVAQDVPPSFRERLGGTTGLLARYLPLIRLRPDVVHFEWNTAATDYLPLFDVWQRPVVTSCHGSDISIYPHLPGGERYRDLLPEVMRRASAVHCVAESLEREAKRFGLDSSRARVIRPGVDVELFRPAPGDADEPAGDGGEIGALRVVSIGWLRWMKGYEYALEAIRALRDSGVPAQLEILGGSPNADVGKRGELQRILHTLRDLDLEQCVCLRGEVTSREVARALQSSHVLLHSSVSEGLPTVLVEAMACGVPIVTTDCGGVREAVADGVEGIVVASRRPDELARALLRLWRDPELRERMGLAGRRTVESRFTLERQLGEYMAMYRAVVGAELPKAPPLLIAEPSAEFREPPDPRCLRIVSAGPLVWEQGFEHSVHAVRLLLDMGVACQYRIVGQGDHLPAVAFARHQLGVRDSVELIVQNGDGAFSAELARADVFVDPSVTDTLPATGLVEAQASGLPCVTTRSQCLNGGNGVIVGRRDPRSIAESLAMLAADPAVSARMASRGRGT